MQISYDLNKVDDAIRLHEGLVDYLKGNDDITVSDYSKKIEIVLIKTGEAYEQLSEIKKQINCEISKLKRGVNEQQD